MQKSEKRIKIFEYLINSLSPNGFIFLQETHSSVDDEKRWCDELNGNLYFSHGKTNSGGVAIEYVGSKSSFFLIEPLIKMVVFYWLKPLLIMLNLS